MILTSTEFITVSEQCELMNESKKRDRLSPGYIKKLLGPMPEEMRAKHREFFCRCQGDAFTIQKTGCCENSAIKFRNFIGSKSYTPS
jgi:hypothetical protein